MYHDPTLNRELKSVAASYYQNLDFDPNWNAFNKRLNKLGYYKGELEGSALYQILEKRAKDQFICDHENMVSSNYSNSLKVINQLLQIPLVEAKNLPTGPNDPDDWLNVEESKIQQNFQSQYNSIDEGVEEEPDKEEEIEIQNLSKLVDGFNGFLNVKSGVSGALFPDETEDNEIDEGLNPDSFFSKIMESFREL
jgi:hypothetical protein